ncbi:MAG: VanW family protein [Clostridiales bacterium]|nr:VanW family protein [Clostridiales bacterium]
MKKIFTVLTIMLVLFTGIFICSKDVAFAESLAPWNVQFTVEYKGDVVAYNLQKEIKGLEAQAEKRGFYLGRKAKGELYRQLLGTGVDEVAVYEYLLPNFSKLLSHFNYVNCARQDASVTFGKNGFCYANGRNGVKINAQKLFEQALRSNGKQLRLTLPLTVDKAVTVTELKQNTVLKSTFTTTYANSAANRCYNIAKAADAIDGTTVGVGETFSFNDIVGDRTVERGYKLSKVILDGNYTEGVGGGVCQVSTTLYNALLLAGFVPHAVQHSLISSYVKAGFDAMVSYGSADLTFTNNTNHPIYIAATTQGKSVTFTVYGEPNVYRIERVSVEERDKFSTTYVVDTDKYPDLIYTDQTKVVTSGSDGVKTQSYLKYYQGEQLVETKLIRKNSYKRVDQVIAHGAEQRPVEQEPM